MDFFCALYPVRCFSCGRPIAELQNEYEGYLEKYENDDSVQYPIGKTLDDLGLDTPCCRNSMMNPTFHPYNMENRLIIEGQESAMSLAGGIVTLAELINVKTLKEQGCNDTVPTGVIGIDFKEVLRINQRYGGLENNEDIVRRRYDTEISTGVEDFMKDEDDEQDSLSKPKYFIDIDKLRKKEEEFQELGKEKGNFVEPDIIGVAKINPRPTTSNPPLVDIGGGDSVPKLPGRTYLCR